MALGAEAGSVVWMVMRQGLFLAVLGLVLGVGLSMSLTKLMGGLLYNTPATDAQTFALVATTLVLIAAIACFLPARRALKIDPVQALRTR
jgi:ABC-type antimicrobial peptide transport system permease subunit